MSSASDMYDIAFIGHVCFDEVIPYQGAPCYAARWQRSDQISIRTQRAFHEAPSI